MTSRIKQASSATGDTTGLSEQELKSVQGGYTATDDLWTWRTVGQPKTIVGGFKSISGLDLETEIIE